jgi:hypothetical protein
MSLLGTGEGCSGRFTGRESGVSEAATRSCQRTQGEVKVGCGFFTKVVFIKNALNGGICMMSAVYNARIEPPMSDRHQRLDYICSLLADLSEMAEMAGFHDLEKAIDKAVSLARDGLSSPV